MHDYIPVQAIDPCTYMYNNYCIQVTLQGTNKVHGLIVVNELCMLRNSFVNENKGI